MLVALVKSARPHQWVKNLFVLAPLVFARSFGDPVALERSVLATLAFCLLSSAVYLMNDVVDAEKDRAHPVKRNRPIASGAVPLGVARVAAVASALIALGVTFALGISCAAAGAAYLLLNLAYSFGLKRIAFIDVACLSLGFLLRVYAGSVAIPVPPSKWLLICTLLLSALLGFGKRAHELRVAGAASVGQRDVLGKYKLATLQRLLGGLAVLVSITYFAYTRSTRAHELVGGRPLFLTVPFVVFGVFRFTWIASRKLDAESPTDSMLRDWPFMLNLSLYAIAILVLISR